MKINHKKWNQLLSLYSDSSFRCSSAFCSLFTCLSNNIFHFRVFGRTSPIGERDTICGGATAKKKQKIAQRQTRPYLWWMDKRALLFQCMQDMGLDLDFSSYSRGTSIILPSYFKLLWCLLQLTCWGDCQIEKITLLLAHDNISWIKTASAASVACSTAFYFQGHPPRTQFTYNNCLVINNVLLDMLLNRISIGNWYYLLQAVIHIAGLLLSCKRY